MSRKKKCDPLEEGVTLASEISLLLLRQVAAAVEDPQGDRSLKAVKEYAGAVKSLQDTLGAGAEIRRKLTEGGDGDTIRILLGEAEEYAN